MAGASTSIEMWAQLVPERVAVAQYWYERQCSIVRMHLVGMDIASIMQRTGASKALIKKILRRAERGEGKGSPALEWANPELAAREVIDWFWKQPKSRIFE